MSKRKASDLADSDEQSCKSDVQQLYEFMQEGAGARAAQLERELRATAPRPAITGIDSSVASVSNIAELTDKGSKSEGGKPKNGLFVYQVKNPAPLGDVDISIKLHHEIRRLNRQPDVDIGFIDNIRGDIVATPRFEDPEYDGKTIGHVDLQVVQVGRVEEYGESLW